MRILFAERSNGPKAAALSVPDALARVRSETGLDLTAARARLGFSRGHLLEIVVMSSSFGSATDDRALDAANLLVPLLVGEEVFDDWVGAIDVGPAPRGGSLRVLESGRTAPDPTLTLAEVRPAVEAAIRGVEAGLPGTPYHRTSDGAEWTLLEAEPEVATGDRDGCADDYPALGDLVLLSTRLPEAMKCLLQGSRFSSCRFSKHGERFVYVKVDGAGLGADARYALRLSIEHALDGALKEPDLGVVVGAGIGARYVYVVLSLASVEDGVRAACSALRARGVPRRAWLLPCDSEHDGEWVPVWEDSPGPPRSAP